MNNQRSALEQEIASLGLPLPSDMLDQRVIESLSQMESSSYRSTSGSSMPLPGLRGPGSWLPSSVAQWTTLIATTACVFALGFAMGQQHRGSIDGPNASLGDTRNTARHLMDDDKSVDHNPQAKNDTNLRIETSPSVIEPLDREAFQSLVMNRSLNETVWGTTQSLSRIEVRHWSTE